MQSSENKEGKLKFRLKNIFLDCRTAPTSVEKVDRQRQRRRLTWTKVRTKKRTTDIKYGPLRPNLVFFPMPPSTTVSSHLKKGYSPCIPQVLDSS